MGLSIKGKFYSIELTFSHIVLKTVEPFSLFYNLYKKNNKQDELLRCGKFIDNQRALLENNNK